MLLKKQFIKTLFALLLAVVATSASENTSFSMEQVVNYWDEAFFENEMILEYDLGHSVVGAEFAQRPGDLAWENEAMTTFALPIFENLGIAYKQLFVLTPEEVSYGSIGAVFMSLPESLIEGLVIENEAEFGFAYEGQEWDLTNTLYIEFGLNENLVLALESETVHAFGNELEALESVLLVGPALNWESMGANWSWWVNYAPSVSPEYTHGLQTSLALEL